MTFIKSKLFVVIGAGALILFVSFLGRGLYRKYQVRQDIKSLERQVAEIEGQNQELLELIDYLKTPDYKEKQARAVLNLQKPGEVAVALPGAESEGAASRQDLPDRKTGHESNYIKWWKYFFAK